MFSDAIALRDRDSLARQATDAYMARVNEGLTDVASKFAKLPSVVVDTRGCTDIAPAWDMRWNATADLPAESAVSGVGDNPARQTTRGFTCEACVLGNLTRPRQRSLLGGGHRLLIAPGCGVKLPKQLSGTLPCTKDVFLLGAHREAPGLCRGLLLIRQGPVYRLTWTLVPPAPGPLMRAPSPLETTLTHSESLPL